MADAKKIREGDKGPFTIWQANYEIYYKEKASPKVFGEYIGKAMLYGFPLKQIERADFSTYWFTGILYDNKIAGKVAGVIPGSPAGNAGIKAGDFIKKCSYGNNIILKEPAEKLIDKYHNISKKEAYHFNESKFALTRASNTTFTRGSFYQDPVFDTYVCYNLHKENEDKKYGKKPFVFKVKSDKKTVRITVVPEKRRCVFFN